MSAAMSDAPSRPWAPDLRVVGYALGLRNGWVALTRLEPGRDGRMWGTASAFLLPNDLDAAVQWVSDSAGADVTLTWTAARLLPDGAERINSSDKPTVARAGDMAGYDWLPVDLDPSDTVTREEYWRRVSAFELPPSLALDSGRGVHAYWRLDDFTTPDRALPVLADLVRCFDSDAATLDPNRNLRLPGTWNPKQDVRRLARVEAYSWDRRYSLDELSARACELSPRPEPIPRGKRERRVLADGTDWPDRYRAAYDLGEELTRVAGPSLGHGSSRRWPCPAGHPGDGPPTLTLHPDNPERAVCHGTGHPDGMGKPSGGRVSFDVLDLHAMEVGQTVEDFMRDERRRQQPAETAAPSPGAEPTAPQVEEWRAPVPLTSAPPPVDIGGLPAVLADIVRASAVTAQAPVEVPLGFALGALSAATRGCWDVVVTPAWNAGPTSLYAVTLADSGERKSAGAKPLLTPLHEAEKRLAVAVRAENRDRAARRKAAEARLKQAERDGDEDGAAFAAVSVHNARSRPVPALMLSDTTTEALGVNMEEQGGAAALFITEATAFRTVAGAYSDSGGNVGLLNHAYDADRYADKRIKRGGVTIPRPFLAWAAAVQTQVLTGYANGTTEGSGFLARFLLLLPREMVGYRDMRTPPVPAAVQEAWNEALTALHARAWEHYRQMADDPADYGEPLRLTFSAPAAELLLDYAQQLEDSKRHDLGLRDLGGWIEKHPARLARIAALFALLDNPYATTVDQPHIRAAMTLASPLVHHATATLRVLRNTGDSGPVRRVLDAVRTLGQSAVTTREVYKSVHGQGWVSKTDDVREVLAELAELGYLRAERVSTGGRPSEVWHVHPSLLPAASVPEGATP